MKASETRTSKVRNLTFARNFISWCFLVFVITDLYILIPAVIADIYNPTTQLLIPTGVPTIEGKAEMERHPVTSEMKRRECSK